MTWGWVADRLARRLTVVCPDLPGFNRSYIPQEAPATLNSCKRVKAAVMLRLMKLLGHDRFVVVGHDRGSLTAFRLTMDHPVAVSRLIIVDGRPVLEHLERAAGNLPGTGGTGFFFAQHEKPERAILTDPTA